MIHYTLNNNRLLPIEYQEVSYLESTGTQYIDTEIYGYMNHYYELDFQCTTSENSRLWGVLGQPGYQGYNMSITWSTNRCVRWSSTSNGTNLVDNIGLINMDRHTIVINNGHIYYDNIYKNISSGHSESCVINYPIYLFTSNPANTTVSNIAKMRLYSYKDVDSNGKLQRHFIPCYRKSDNKPGLFDIVEQKFYINQGTGEFLVGNPINEIVEVENGGGGSPILDDKTEYSKQIPESGLTNIKKHTSIKYVYPNEDYTVMFEAKASVAGAGIWAYFYNNTSGVVQIVGYADGATRKVLTTEYQQYIIHYKFGSTGNPANKSILIRLSPQKNYTGVTVYVKNIKLYRGNIQQESSNAQLNNVGYSYGIEGQYDKNIYTESDGSKWIRIFHHNNPANALFSSSDTFTTGVYKDADRWFDMAKCNEVNKWEFILKQKTTSDATESKYRFIQYVNPMTATYDDVTNDKIKRISDSRRSRDGGIYHVNAFNTYFITNNGTRNNWHGAIGSWTQYSNRCPGWNNQVVTTGFMDLYLRIDNVCPMYSGCYQFNHSTITTDYQWNPTTYSVSVWVKDFTTQGTIFRNNTKYSPTIDISGSTLRFFHWIDTSTYKMIQMSASKLQSGWNHLVISYNGNVLKAFINGKLEGSLSTTYDLYNTGDLVIGYDSNVGYYKGYMSDFRIYDYVLTDDEIMNLYKMKEI